MLTLPIGAYQWFYVELTNNPDDVSDDERTDPIPHNIYLINDHGFLRVSFIKK